MRTNGERRSFKKTCCTNITISRPKSSGLLTQASISEWRLTAYSMSCIEHSPLLVIFSLPIMAKPRAGKADVRSARSAEPKTAARERTAFILDRLTQTRMRDVVIVAGFAERIAAAFDTTIRTNRSSTVGALSHSTVATWSSNTAIAAYVFNLAVGIHRSCRLP
jgi:hypothetical protein